jgi:hypothetical protein
MKTCHRYPVLFGRIACVKPLHEIGYLHTTKSAVVNGEEIEGNDCLFSRCLSNPAIS